MTAKRLLSALLMVVATQWAMAQDIVLTSTSASHPYERGQWTKAQCDEWQTKYGPIRGINCPYPPCDAISQKEAIAKAASMGYNSVRWWPGGNTNTQSYIDAVEQWAAWADEYGMTVSPVFGFTYSYYNMSNKEAALKQLETQVRTIIRHFRGDERIILWDVWNEPNMYDADTEPMMNWISQIVQWAHEEGCTQPLSASIVWDGGVGTNNATSTGLRIVRDNTERLMDVHNYHDYNCQESFNGETASMVNRLKKLGDRPLVCTECMTRTNGSTYARTLTDFAKYNVNFYTWGLYACDPNWEVKWSRSAFYNWEPMFHNALYMDGEPYGESEPQWVKNFEFRGTAANTDPGIEYTDVWDPRRAWRRVNHAPAKGLYATSLSEASSLIATHKDDPDVSTIAVRLDYSSYASNSNNMFTLLSSVLNAAEAAGMTMLPILIDSETKLGTTSAMQNYVYNVVNKYYTDRRIEGWCLLRQTNAAMSTQYKTLLPELFHKARYAFANQPLLAAPLTDFGTQPSAEADDVANLMWQLSDVCAYAGDKDEATNEWLCQLTQTYRRPIYTITTEKVEQHSADRMNNNEDRTQRMPAWKAWRWYNRVPTKGISYASIVTALRGLNTMLTAGHTDYNSVSVQLDYHNYTAGEEKFFHNIDSLLGMAEKLGMTVLPRMMADAHITAPINILEGYITATLSRYAQDERIIGWDLYNKVCATSSNVTKATQILDMAFPAARATGACQPIFVTPSVSAKTFATDFDYIGYLEHGKYNGWSYLQYGSGNIKLCYKAWCMSDVISYASNQTSAHLGWTNSIACKFGRPLLCLEWKPATAENLTNVMNIFQDMHIAWYVNGTLNASLLQGYHYIPISTAH